MVYIFFFAPSAYEINSSASPYAYARPAYPMLFSTRKLILLLNSSMDRSTVFQQFKNHITIRKIHSGYPSCATISVSKAQCASRLSSGVSSAISICCKDESGLKTE